MSDQNFYQEISYIVPNSRGWTKEEYLKAHSDYMRKIAIRRRVIRHMENHVIRRATATENLWEKMNA